MDQTVLFDDIPHSSTHPTARPTFVNANNGKTCGSCSHLATIEYAGRYFKCDLIRGRWTHGPGTDIRKKDPACEKYEAES